MIAHDPETVAYCKSILAFIEVQRASCHPAALPFMDAAKLQFEQHLSNIAPAPAEAE